MEAHTPTPARGGIPRRLATETKQAFKTTEFWIYLVILVGLLIAGAVSDADESVSSGDGFGPEKVWLYAVILTVGYLISRGLAKAGSRDPYWDDPTAGGDGNSFGERVRTAAQVLKEGEPTDSRTTGAPRQ